jgi:hypothetical protein
MIEAGLEGALNIAPLASSGYRDEQQVHARLQISNAFCDFVATEAGHADIENDDLRIPCLENPECLDAVMGNPCLEPFCPQNDFETFHGIAVVVYGKHASAHSACLGEHESSIGQSIEGDRLMAHHAAAFSSEATCFLVRLIAKAIDRTERAVRRLRSG